MDDLDKHVSFWDKRAGEFIKKGLIENVPLLLKTINKYSKDSFKLLEVGCGEGRLMNETEAYGVDFSPKMLEKNDYYPTRAKLAMAQNLPFSDNYFDVAYTHSCFMHLPFDQISDAISEIQRVAKIIIICEWQGAEGEVSYYNQSLCSAGCYSHDYKKLFDAKLLETIDANDNVKIWVFEK